MKRGKKLFAILLVLAVAVSMMPIFALTASAEEPTHVVTAGSLNVREGPGADQTRIGGQTKDSKVVVVETQDGWSRIVYGTGYGWVDSQYLKEIPY